MITLPKKPKVIESKDNTASIEITELYPGYGATIGNALRRTLYSSLPGAAVTSAKIQNVAHEFSTIDGVLEDVIEITLKLKQINLKLHGDEPQTITLKAKGKKSVTAKDIETPSQVEILNKDLHLATLTSAKSSLNIEMTVEKGYGYVKAETGETTKKEIGVIRLDAIFSPVKKVNFEVENMRVGDRTDYNKLVMQITTDGTITPEQAFGDATKVLIDHFNVLASAGEAKTKKKTATKKTTAKKTTAKKATTKKTTTKKATKKK